MDTLPAALEEEAEDEPLAVVAAVSLAPRTDTPLMMLPPLRFEEYVTAVTHAATCLSSPLSCPKACCSALKRLAAHARLCTPPGGCDRCAQDTLAAAGAARAHVAACQSVACPLPSCGESVTLRTALLPLLFAISRDVAAPFGSPLSLVDAMQSAHTPCGAPVSGDTLLRLVDTTPRGGTRRATPPRGSAPMLAFLRGAAPLEGLSAALPTAAAALLPQTDTLPATLYSVAALRSLDLTAAVVRRDWGAACELFRILGPREAPPDVPSDCCVAGRGALCIPYALDGSPAAQAEAAASGLPSAVAFAARWSLGCGSAQEAMARAVEAMAAGYLPGAAACATALAEADFVARNLELLRRGCHPHFADARKWAGAEGGGAEAAAAGAKALRGACIGAAAALCAHSGWAERAVRHLHLASHCYELTAGCEWARAGVVGAGGCAGAGCDAQRTAGRCLRAALSNAPRAALALYVAYPPATGGSGGEELLSSPALRCAITSCPAGAAWACAYVIGPLARVEAAAAAGGPAMCTGACCAGRGPGAPRLLARLSRSRCLSGLAHALAPAAGARARAAVAGAIACMVGTNKVAAAALNADAPDLAAAVVRAGAPHKRRPAALSSQAAAAATAAAAAAALAANGGLLPTGGLGSAHAPPSQLLPPPGRRLRPGPCGYDDCGSGCGESDDESGPLGALSASSATELRAAKLCAAASAAVRGAPPPGHCTSAGAVAAREAASAAAVASLLKDEEAEAGGGGGAAGGAKKGGGGKASGKGGGGSGGGGASSQQTQALPAPPPAAPLPSSSADEGANADGAAGGGDGGAKKKKPTRRGARKNGRKATAVASTAAATGSDADSEEEGPPQPHAALLQSGAPGGMSSLSLAPSPQPPAPCADACCAPRLPFRMPAARKMQQQGAAAAAAAAAASTSASALTHAPSPGASPPLPPAADADADTDTDVDGAGAAALAAGPACVWCLDSRTCAAGALPFCVAGAAAGAPHAPALCGPCAERVLREGRDCPWCLARGAAPPLADA